MHFDTGSRFETKLCHFDISFWKLQWHQTFIGALGCHQSQLNSMKFSVRSMKIEKARRKLVQHFCFAPFQLRNCSLFHYNCCCWCCCCYNSAKVDVVPRSTIWILEKNQKFTLSKKYMQIGEEICFAKRRIYARRFLLKLRLNNRPPPQPTTTFLHTYGKFA